MKTNDYIVNLDDIQNEDTGVRSTGFYNSKKWRKIRDSIRIRDKMTCQHCGLPIVGRSIVDHIEPLNLLNVHEWAVAYNPDNLQLLCLECHNIKTFSKTKKAKSRW